MFRGYVGGCCISNDVDVMILRPQATSWVAIPSDAPEIALQAMSRVYRESVQLQTSRVWDEDISMSYVHKE
jgi:hypothetical protein